MTIEVGERFPAKQVNTVDGLIDLTDRWSRGPLVIAFHRLWCPFCQQAAAQLSSALPQLHDMGADAMIVYREDVHTVAEVCSERNISVTCASDSDRGLEKAVDVPRFGLLKYGAFGPVKLVRALRDASIVRGVKRDTLQGRGSFVINPQGRVVFVHVATNAADIPFIDDVIAAAKSAAA